MWMTGRDSKNGWYRLLGEACLTQRWLSRVLKRGKIPRFLHAFEAPSASTQGAEYKGCLKSSSAVSVCATEAKPCKTLPTASCWPCGLVRQVQPAALR